MPSSPRYIYLDNAATTRVAPEVAEVARACFEVDFGNPASAHHVGIAAERRVKAARARLLAAVGDDGDVGDIVWTSGGTESDALGVVGAARARRGRGIVVSALEHSAVRQSAAMLAGEGWRVTTLPATPAGVVEAERVADAVDADTAVVALMLVNNEIGTLQPVAEAARAAREASPDVHVHCDAVQALGKVPVDAPALAVDSLAVSAHKFHGPKGVGALWLRKRARISPLWAGGGQQRGLRSGTLNVPGIAAMAAAADLATTGLAERAQRWRELADQLVRVAAETGVEVRQNGADAPRAPHVVSLAFRGIPAEPLLHVLESRGVLVSAGSACSERDRKPSPVLAAIGLDRAFGTLRFSFGRDTTREEIDAAAEILVDAVRSF